MSQFTRIGQAEVWLSTIKRRLGRAISDIDQPAITYIRPPVGVDERTSSHQLIFEEVKAYVAHQSEQMDVLDSKAGLVAATATALVAGYLALIHGGDPNTFHALEVTVGYAFKVSAHTLHFLLYMAAFASYAIFFYPTFRATRLVEWELVPKPTTLIDEYWGKTADQTMSDLVATLEKASIDNEPRINTKRKWVGRAYIALGIQVGILAGASLVGAWHNLI